MPHASLYLIGGCLLSACIAWNLHAADNVDAKSAPATSKPEESGLKYNDGTADGKKSLGGSGELIKFTLPEDKQKIGGIRIHGSRYGVAQPPKEKFLIYFLSSDGKEVLSTQMAPYSSFNRGNEQWVPVRFAKPVEVPKEFWVCLDFRPHQTKGVYVSYDTSTGGKYSKSGLPGLEPDDVEFGGDWMIELLPGK